MAKSYRELGRALKGIRRHWKFRGCPTVDEWMSDVVNGRCCDENTSCDLEHRQESLRNFHVSIPEGQIFMKCGVAPP